MRRTARATAAQATADRILDAATAVFWERPTSRVSLEEVAQRAGVTKQTVLVSHYERVGDAVLRLIAEETRDPALRAFADRGRAYHERWCHDTFSPALAAPAGAEPRRRLAELIAVTEVAVWRLLRDRLSRGQTETALRELLAPLVEGAR